MLNQSESQQINDTNFFDCIVNYVSLSDVIEEKLKSDKLQRKQFTDDIKELKNEKKELEGVIIEEMQTKGKKKININKFGTFICENTTPKSINMKELKTVFTNFFTNDEIFTDIDDNVKKEMLVRLVNSIQSLLNTKEKHVLKHKK